MLRSSASSGGPVFPELTLPNPCPAVVGKPSSGQMRDAGQKGIGAGISIAAHVAFFGIILSLPKLHLDNRTEPLPMPVYVELIPEPEPIPPEVTQEPENEAPPPRSTARAERQPTTIIPVAPTIEVSLPVGEPVMSARQAKPAPLLDRTSVFAAQDAPTGSAQAPSNIRADWIMKPSAAVMNDHFPYVARLHKISGRVVLTCLIDRTNRARNCRILEEVPRQFDFGDAALKAAQTFQIRAPVVDGKTRHDVWVRIPIAFDYRR